MRRVFLVDCPFEPELRRAGYEVRTLWTGSEILDLPSELDRLDFRPDLVVQAERLDRRTVLTGLAETPGIKVFWSLDTHLNLFWQRHYARLFDGALSTQPHLAGPLGATGTAAGWLPWGGQKRPFVPHSRRIRNMLFVGRVTPERPRRGRMTDFLGKRFGLETISGLSHRVMLERYDATRVVPNETISGEINLRLFEAASCGCAVIGDPPPPGGEGLFEVGRETAVARHALEMAERAAWLLARPERAEAMGRAAWERVNAEHLPERRAEALMRFALGLSGGAATGAAADAALGLTLAALLRGRRTTGCLGRAIGLLSAAPFDPEALAWRLRLMTETGRADEAARLAEWILAADAGRGDPELDAAGCLAAWRLNRPEMAKAFVFRRLVADGKMRSPPDGTHFAALRFQAGVLAAAGRDYDPGFVYVAGIHLPGTAAECLIEALRLRPADLPTLDRLNRVLAAFPGSDMDRLGILSHLGLHHPGDWRTQLDLALVNLRLFRVPEGLGDAFVARRAAEAGGQRGLFDRSLDHLDPGGLIMRSLDAAAAPDGPGGPREQGEPDGKDGSRAAPPGSGGDAARPGQTPVATETPDAPDDVEAGQAAGAAEAGEAARVVSAAQRSERAESDVPDGQDRPGVPDGPGKAGRDQPARS